MNNQFVLKKYSWVIYIFAVCVLILRAPDRFLIPQLWAEDGHIFLIDSLTDGLGSLFKPYAGYLLFFIRLVALPSPLVPFEWIPAYYYAGSVGLVLFSMWLIQSSRFDFAMKPLLALCLVLVPFPGAVYLNLTNAQWFLAPAIPFLLLQAPAEKKIHAWFDAFIILGLGLTGPFLTLWSPLLFLRLKVRGFNRMDVPVYFGCILAIAAQVLSFLTSERGIRPGNSDAETNLIADAVMALVLRPLGCFALGDVAIHAPLISGIIGLLLGLWALYAIWKLPSPWRLCCFGFIGAGLIVLLAGYCSGGTLWQHLIRPGEVGERYYIPLFILLMQCLLIVAFSVSSVRLIGQFILLPVLLTIVTGFELRALPDLEWRRLSHKAMTRPGKTRIPINPVTDKSADWDITVRPLDSTMTEPFLTRDFVIKASGESKFKVLPAMSADEPVRMKDH